MKKLLITLYIILLAYQAYGIAAPPSYSAVSSEISLGISSATLKSGDSLNSSTISSLQNVFKENHSKLVVLMRNDKISFYDKITVTIEINEKGAYTKHDLSVNSEEIKKQIAHSLQYSAYENIGKPYRLIYLLDIKTERVSLVKTTDIKGRKLTNKYRKKIEDKENTKFGIFNFEVIIKDRRAIKFMLPKKVSSLEKRVGYQLRNEIYPLLNKEYSLIYKADLQSGESVLLKIKNGDKIANSLKKKIKRRYTFYNRTIYTGVKKAMISNIDEQFPVTITISKDGIFKKLKTEYTSKFFKREFTKAFKTISFPKASTAYTFTLHIGVNFKTVRGRDRNVGNNGYIGYDNIIKDKVVYFSPANIALFKGKYLTKNSCKLFKSMLDTTDVFTIIEQGSQVNMLGTFDDYSLVVVRERYNVAYIGFVKKEHLAIPQKEAFITSVKTIKVYDGFDTSAVLSSAGKIIMICDSFRNEYEFITPGNNNIGTVSKKDVFFSKTAVSLRSSSVYMNGKLQKRSTQNYLIKNRRVTIVGSTNIAYKIKQKKGTVWVNKKDLSLLANDIAKVEDGAATASDEIEEAMRNSRRSSMRRLGKRGYKYNDIHDRITGFTKIDLSSVKVNSRGFSLKEAYLLSEVFQPIDVKNNIQNRYMKTFGSVTVKLSINKMKRIDNITFDSSNLLVDLDLDVLKEKIRRMALLEGFKQEGAVVEFTLWFSPVMRIE